MRTRLSLSVVGSLVCATIASAQVQPGDIAMVSLVDYQFCVFDGAGTPTYYGLSNTTGLGFSTNTNAIVWDPANSQSFILGGEGWIGRISITGPGTANYSLITNAVGIISQLSFDNAGKLIAIDSTTDEVLKVDPSTGAVTQLTVGPHPWGVELNAGAIDPATGEIFVGTNQALYRIAPGATTGTLLSSNWSTGQFAFCTGIAFDPNSSDLFVSILTADRIVRMNRTSGAITDLVPAKTIQSCNSIAVDDNGDVIVGGWQNKLYRIAIPGSSATLIGQASNQGVLATAVDVVKEVCDGTALPYGAGCPGSGFFTPVLALEGCPVAGSNVTLAIKKGLGGSFATLLFGLVPANVPVGGGCALLVAPLIGPQIVLPLAGFGPGTGTLDLPGFIPLGTSGVSFTMQVFVIDPSTTLGASASNGVQVVIP
jgi:hypothetical protein